MPLTSYNKFITTYVANEYSNLIINSIISKDFSTSYKILSDIKNYDNLTSKIRKLVLLKVVFKLLKLMTPSLIVRIFK